jgi:hypothetical protein
MMMTLSISALDGIGVCVMVAVGAGVFVIVAVGAMV